MSAPLPGSQGAPGAGLLTEADRDWLLGLRLAVWSIDGLSWSRAREIVALQREALIELRREEAAEGVSGGVSAAEAFGDYEELALALAADHLTDARTALGSERGGSAWDIVGIFALVVGAALALHGLDSVLRWGGRPVDIHRTLAVLCFVLAMVLVKEAWSCHLDGRPARVARSIALAALAVWGMLSAEGLERLDVGWPVLMLGAAALLVLGRRVLGRRRSQTPEAPTEEPLTVEGWLARLDRVLRWDLLVGGPARLLALQRTREVLLPDDAAGGATPTEQLGPPTVWARRLLVNDASVRASYERSRARLGIALGALAGLGAMGELALGRWAGAVVLGAMMLAWLACGIIGLREAGRLAP